MKESLNGTFFHTWEWNEVIEKGFNSEAFPVVVEDESEHKLVGIFPFFIRNLFEDYKIHKYLPAISKHFQIGYSPHHKLYSFGGPCVPSGISNCDEIYNSMFDFLNAYIRKRKSITGHVIYPYHESLDAVLAQNGFTKTRSKKTAIINIEKNLDEICKGFKRQFRKDLRIASRNGVVISESSGSIEDVSLFFNYFQKILIDRIIEQTNNDYKKVSNALLPYSYFGNIREILFPKKMAKLFFAEYNGEKIGALINFYYKDTIYVGHTSALRGEYNGLNAYKLLIWHSIVDGKENNFKSLDLTGLHHDESNGQYQFKMGFNGQIKELSEYMKSYRYDNIKNLNKLLNKGKASNIIQTDE